jgi:hypothetical protein
MNQAIRTIAAFLLAPPLAVGVYLIVAFCLVLLQDGGEQAVVDLARSARIFIIGSAVAYVFELVFGLPIYFLLRWLDIVSPWVTIVLAASVGTVFNLLPELGPKNPTTYFSTADCQVIVAGARTACGYWHLALGTLFTASIGAIAGLAFWLIYAGGWRLRPRNS